MKKKLSTLLSSLLAVAMVVMALPVQAFAEESGDSLTNLALGKDFIQYWVGSDGSQGGDNVQQTSDKVKNPDDYRTNPDTGNPYTVKEAEEITVNLNGAGEKYDNAKSGNRLTDGYIVTDPEHNTFDAKWVNTLWCDSDTTRGKYVQAYRNDSRDMILDLGQVSNIKRLSLHMGDCSAYGISAPLYVTYYLADEEDGPYYLAGTCYAYAENAKYANMATKDPNTVITQNGENGKPEPPMDHWYYDVDNIDYNARYVRVCFDMSVWAFIDELQVFGNETPSENAQDLTANEEWKPETTYNAYATSGSEDVTDNHEFLAYTGYYQSGKNEDGSIKVGTTQKNVDQFKKMISYVDEAGNPTDWLFDQVTFLNHGVAKSGHYDTSRSDVADPSDYKNYSTIEDWNQWLNHIFNEDIEDENPSGELLNLDALNKAAGDVKAALKDDTNKVKVHISIAPPVYHQSQWCTTEQAVEFNVSTDSAVDFTMKGHNHNIDETVESRMVAMDWFLDQIIDRFNEKGYENIELAGFYYFDEVILSTADNAAGKTITALNELIHSKGDYESYWIPFYQAEGYKKWEDYGFDYAIMQPNYIFDVNASKTRVDDCAALAKKYGLGIEMEYNGTGDVELAKFKEYLSKGQSLGYQKENSRMAWYMSTDGLSPLVTSPTYRYLYDAIYDYINGRIPVLEPDQPTPEPPKTNDLNGKTITIKAEQSKADIMANANKVASTLLTDGLYGQAWGNGVISATNPIIAFVNGNAAGPFTITADMGIDYQFSQVYLDFFTWMSAGVGIPDQVTYSISSDGQNWTELGSVKKGTSTDLGSDLTREMYLLTLDGEVIGRYLKAEFSKGMQLNKKPVAAGVEGASPWGWIGFDEFGAVAAPVVDITKSFLTEDMISLDFETINNEGPANNNNANKAHIVDKVYSDNWDYSEGQPNLYKRYTVYNKTFLEGKMTVQASFGNSYDLDMLSMTFYHDGTVFRPSGVTYYASDDGETWTELGLVQTPSEVEVQGTDRKFTRCIYTLNVSDVTAKYVKAVFTHADGQGWMGCDEFSVIGTKAEVPTPETYTVSVNTPANGTASLDKTAVEAGESAVLTFAPNSGYQLKDVKVNGVSVGKVTSPYTIANITANTTVEVEFEKIETPTPTPPPTPSTGGGSIFEPAAPSEINKDEAIADINNSDKAEVTVTTTQPDVVASDIFKAAKDAEKPITFDVVDGNGKTEYKWEFQKIDNPQIAMSLELEVSDLSENAELKELAEKENGLVLEFMHSGMLPGKVNVTVSVADKFADGSAINLYYYNEIAGRFEVVAKDLVVKDGYITFELTHCSKYVLTGNEIEGAVVVDSADTSSNPQTGDATSAAAVAGIFGLGLIALGAAYIIRRKDEEEA